MDLMMIQGIWLGMGSTGALPPPPPPPGVTAIMFRHPYHPTHPTIPTYTHKWSWLIALLGGFIG